MGRIAKRDTNEYKYAQAMRASSVLSHIPTIELVGVSGALAMGDAKEDDDIDLFIVTAQDTLWVTRALSFLVLRFAKIPVRRFGEKDVSNKLCLNLWVDKKNLDFSEREEIYTAHETVQVKALFDRGGIYKKLIEANSWIEKFFPNAFKVLKVENGEDTSQEQGVVHKLSTILVRLFEVPVRLIQMAYMSRRKTKENVSKGKAFFHPLDWKETIPKVFLLRLEQISKGKQPVSPVSAFVEN